jgi:sulfate adenylyltransferase subunit 1 (EFTu-like GTPase family)
VRSIEALLDLESLAWQDGNGDGQALGANDIGRVVVEAQHPLPFDPFDKVRASGAIVLIDATTNRTVAAGMLREAA